MKSVLSHTFAALLAALLTFACFKKQVAEMVRNAQQPAYEAAAMKVSQPIPADEPAIEVEAPEPKTARRTAELPVDFRTVARKATPAVVSVLAYGSSGYRSSAGSGVIISSDGYIITNKHVIEDGSRYEVALVDRRKLKAALIGTDDQTDLALLKVDETGLPVLEYGNSDRLEIGEWVMAIGSPFELSSTVTAGIVSAKGRSINILDGAYSVEAFIQTDAAINPGNSGGALVNLEGNLVGINTAIITDSGYSEGYSFAIPANLARKVIADLREFGEVRRGVLGVNIIEITDEAARDLQLPSVEGVLIKDVTRGGSAEGSGLKAGDVIVSVNSVPTRSVPELQELIARFRPGDQVNLEYYRNGRRFRKSGVPLKSLN
ncbi:MAG TPA: trypsin-like peptidase domain-containing protein [Flavilitoribacter sp.]|nr:trypsin-like peptidase domain-containing protein [Flavilitoribacter sp.]